MCNIKVIKVKNALTIMVLVYPFIADSIKTDKLARNINPTNRESQKFILVSNSVIASDRGAAVDLVSVAGGAAVDSVAGEVPALRGEAAGEVAREAAGEVAREVAALSILGVSAIGDVFVLNNTGKKWGT